ncbi:hypothetical protein [Alteribacillus sp. HJP-4]|uniref:hypothetical protein n=1 Tax=Alteribacillus sp. HJP-4 TaxID=2775394 RepID=UPI0035CCCDEB
MQLLQVLLHITVLAGVLIIIADQTRRKKKNKLLLLLAVLGLLSVIDFTLSFFN